MEKEDASTNELIDRLTFMTEELERMINISRGERIGVRRFTFADARDSTVGKKPATTPLLLYRLVRLALVHNLISAALAYRTGKKLGKEIAPGSMKELIEEVEKLGLGQLEIETLDPHLSIFRLRECAACAGVSRGEDPVCHLEAGLLAGMLESATGSETDMRETHCVVTGAEYCRFEAQETRGGALKEMIDRVAMDYSAENVKLLSTLASHAMTALENAILYEKTKRLVVVDSLTYTYNRRYFEERLREEFARSQRHNYPLSLVMMDIDKFKQHNDTYGHLHGDRVLRTVARIMRDNLRGIDIVARYGGDEFVVILPQTDENGLQGVAERIRSRIAEEKIVEPETHREVPVTVAVGTSVYPQNASTANELLSQADQALYKAKQLGGNRSCMFILREVK